MSNELTRADRIKAQHDAYALFFWLYQDRPELMEEERRNRAKLSPTNDTGAVVRALSNGALTGKEAADLLERIEVQG